MSVISRFRPSPRGQGRWRCSLQTWLTVEGTAGPEDKSQRRWQTTAGVVVETGPAAQGPTLLIPITDRSSGGTVIHGRIAWWQLIGPMRRPRIIPRTGRRREP